MNMKQINKMHEMLDSIKNEVSKLETHLAALEYECEKQDRDETEVKGQDFECLAITNVQVFPFKETASLGHMKGLAVVVFNDQLMLRGLRIMEGENGLFVGYPNDPFYKGEEFRHIAQPITRQLREHIEACVLEKYHAAIA